MIKGVKVHLQAISQIVESRDVNLILLVNEENDRQLAVMCDQDVSRQLGRRLEHKEMGWEQHLPEVCVALLSLAGEDFALHINSIDNGVYKASFVNLRTKIATPIKCSEGILMAVVGEYPIYVDEGLMRAMSAPYSASSTRAALPISAIPDHLIKKSMDKAIQDEDYELASELKQELSRREGKEHKCQ